MPVKPFLDTNIVLYAFDPSHKGDVAERLLANGGPTSVQVLNEFVNASRRRLGLDWSEISDRLEVVRALLDSPSPITLELHEDACAIARRYKLSFFDALLISSALSAECSLLLSEDMQHGLKVKTLVVQNPFIS